MKTFFVEPETLELAIGETKEIRVWAFPAEVKIYKVDNTKADRINYCSPPFHEAIAKRTSSKKRQLGYPSLRENVFNEFNRVEYYCCTC